MPSLREIRQKIRAVGAQQRIFKAMKMIAAARMRKSQSAILAARPFAIKMEQLVRELALRGGRDESGLVQSLHHPFFEARPEDGPVALVLVTADKGLCGAFNANLIRGATEWFKAHRSRKVYMVAVGRKGRDFLHRIRGFDFEILNEMAGVFPKVHFSHAEILGKTLIDAFEEKKLSKVSVLYNEFKSVAAQKLVNVQILPVPPFSQSERADSLADYGFEPGQEELLSALLPRYIKAQLYRILLESQAAELAARMNAMDAASKNAKELRETLNLGLNRQRQAIITKEIAELVGGAEALAA
ncbi:MAG: ATP synthase F1 subunit gamma [Elusimicrobia bacterium]|nr:ATP synthase F1 subunit gamma [Elusimicrobiota bacterium]